MNRLISVFGALLVLVGMGLLAYVGMTYAQNAAPDVHIWSRSQEVAGHTLASTLSRHQNVAVPLSRAVVAVGEPAIRMAIPKIGVDSRVVQTAPAGGIWPVADWAVGHLNTTPEPGVAGNGAYAAHDDIKGEIFKRVGSLVPGDIIKLYTRHTVYRYVVVGQLTVDPSDVKVLAATRGPTVTLVTCTPYWVDTSRLIIKAVLKSSAPA